MYVSSYPFTLKGTGAFSSNLPNRRFDSIEYTTYKVVPYVKSVSNKYTDVVGNYIETSVNRMMLEFKEDGSYLNHLLGPKKNPTTENICKWTLEKVNEMLNTFDPNSKDEMFCYKVVVQESEGNVAVYED